MSWTGSYDLVPDSPEAQAWHAYYYNSGIIGRTRWMGTLIGKCPSDLVTYATVIHEVQPELLIETGTNYGGSALFFAHCMDIVGKGRVVTIDPFECPDGLSRPRHPRIHYLRQSSIVATPADLEGSASVAPRMVVLDAVHAAGFVYEELMRWAPLVTLGSYCVVEDTNLNGHPVAHSHGPGPAEAVAAFLATPVGRTFVADRTRECFGLTMQPGGWLRRIA